MKAKGAAVGSRRKYLIGFETRAALNDWSSCFTCVCVWYESVAMSIKGFAQYTIPFFALCAVLSE